MTDKIITFIYSEDCEDCKKMQKMLLDIIRFDNNCGYRLREIDSEMDEAIELGVKYSLSDLPACIIGDKVFYKNQYKEIEKAIESSWKETQIVRGSP